MNERMNIEVRAIRISIFHTEGIGIQMVNVTDMAGPSSILRI
jgi:hypothetical protein